MVCLPASSAPIRVLLSTAKGHDSTMLRTHRRNAQWGVDGRGSGRMPKDAIWMDDGCWMDGWNRPGSLRHPFCQCEAPAVPTVKSSQVARVTSQLQQERTYFVALTPKRTFHLGPVHLPFLLTRQSGPENSVPFQLPIPPPASAPLFELPSLSPGSIPT